jgi:Fur family transcriptional regulator, ferric uptake regulator
MPTRTDAAWTAHALETLEDAGHRSSTPRTEVVGALAELGCSVSAAEIADHLRDQGRGVGVASIYRTLELLDRLKLVQRCGVDEATARYEPAHPTGEHHHHLVCDNCGAVTAFEDEDLERAIKRLAGRVDFEIDAHDVTLRGECPTCHTAGR